MNILNSRELARYALAQYEGKLEGELAIACLLYTSREPNLVELNMYSVMWSEHCLSLIHI